MILGYTIPISITLLTLIVELFLPKCSEARPRFGELTCFFHKG